MNFTIKYSSIKNYIVFVWLIFNATLMLIPTLYYAVTPYYTYIVLAFFALLILAKSSNMNLKSFKSIFAVYALLIVFLMIQKKNPTNYLTILSSPIALICFDGLSFSERGKDVFRKLFLVQWLVLAVLSVGYFTKYNSNTSEFINSNVLGMLFLNFSMLTIYYNYILKSRYKIKNFLVSSITFFALYFGFRARGCTIAFACFVLMCLFRRLLFKNKKIIIMIAIIIVIIGAIIPFVYVSLVGSGLFGSNNFGVKNIYTRYQVWFGVTNAMRSNISYVFLGLPKELLDLYGYALHNNSLEIITYIGVFGMIAYYVFLLGYLTRVLFAPSYDKCNDFLIISFLTILILGFTEVTFFWAITYVLHYLYLGIASGKGKY